MEPSCTIHEFAAQTGVTVRALQHYDRLGLLCPPRSSSGYRRYSKTDTGRLRQIQALQWVGLPLKEIGRLLDDESADVAEALNTQRTQLEERRQRLDAAIAAIRQAGFSSPDQRGQILHVIRLNWGMATHQPDLPLAKRISEGVREWGVRFAERHSAEELEQMKKESADLFRDAAAAVDLDPAGPEGRSIAARYRQMMAKQALPNPGQPVSALLLHRWFPVFPAALGLESKLENFSDGAWIFLGKALAASEE